MACPACRRHVQEAGAYRWAVDQARPFLRHEFDCQGDGGPNALLGCLACVLDRLALRASPEITLAAARQPWLERAAAIIADESLTDAAYAKACDEILAGLARVTKLAEIRQRAAARQVDKEREGRERRAETIRTELATPKVPAVIDKGSGLPRKPPLAPGRRKGAKGKGKGRGAVKRRAVGQPAPPAAPGGAPAPAIP